MSFGQITEQCVADWVCEGDEISTSERHTLMVKESGTVWYMGEGRRGQGMLPGELRETVRAFTETQLSHIACWANLLIYSDITEDIF